MILTMRLYQIGKMSIGDTIQYTLMNQLLQHSHCNQSYVGIKEISDLIIDESLHCNNSEFYTLGILADESTRGSTKVFVVCFMYWNEKNRMNKIGHDFKKLL